MFIPSLEWSDLNSKSLQQIEKGVDSEDGKKQGMERPRHPPTVRRAESRLISGETVHIESGVLSGTAAEEVAMFLAGHAEAQFRQTSRNRSCRSSRFE
jgi:hypothetical protein